MGRVVDLTEYLFGLVTEEVVCPFTIFFALYRGSREYCNVYMYIFINTWLN